MELAFAGLHQLLAPMLDRLAGLPAPQRDAVRTAFGVSPGSAPDRFFVALAVLSLLAEVAEERPLVCASRRYLAQRPTRLGLASLTGIRLALPAARRARAMPWSLPGAQAGHGGATGVGQHPVQLLARVDAAALAAQPFAVEQTRAV
jgi:hypothetical protein